SFYRNLEREFVSLSNLIHINDEQLKIYSIKIAELLIRTVVEVESISKELYFLNGGDKDDDKDLFFDTDCIQLLEDNWKLSKKVIFVSSPNLYFDIDDNKILTPLKKANKRGSSSSDWLKAYQAVKHNRGKNLKKGNLKHLIRALGGLYILNIYYRDTFFQLEKDGTGTNFDSSLGSELFSVKVHVSQSISIDKDYTIKPNYDECIYLLKATDKTREDVQKAIKDINTKTNERIKENLNQELQERLTNLESSTKEDVEKNLKDVIDKIKNDYTIQVAKENGLKLKQTFE
ncbi:unnamed protein product, partial [Ectocarpus sp. 12 AP-2014]